jgi:ABC-type transport system involved in multi-copper enzyme maturation permease subunit
LNPARAATIARAELSFGLKRPLSWIWGLILVLSAWGLSTGSMQISTGDSSVGGTKAWLTSEFSQSFQFAVIGLLLYGFFVSVAAGMAILRDGESRVSELLHATPLTPGEYVWGKFLGLCLSFAAITAIHVTANVFFNHALVGGADAEYVGPLVLTNYLRPALFFGAPVILFLAGVTLAAGTLGRRPILIYFLPVSLLLGCGFFLWEWNPHWLAPGWDRVLMALDPAGLRWLQHTWLDVDRGVEFYNTQAVGLDGLFVGSRLVFVLLGLGAVVLTHRRLARALRGAHPVRRARAAGREEPATEAAPAAPVALAILGMSGARLGFLGQVLAITRVELRELRSSPGLYLFGPLILLQTVGVAFARTGAFDTPLLWTSGLMAQASFNTLTLLVCLLLLFYTVESLERERTAGLSPIFAAASLANGAILLGKTLANALLGALVILLSFLACALVLVLRREAPLELAPFALLWGALLLPTFLLWNAFVAAAWALLRNRYTTYALALGVLVLSGWLQLTGKMNWVGNWNLWSAVVWSDLAPLELDRQAYVLNRVLALGTAAFFVALALRFLERREADPIGRATRRRPRALLRAALGLAPFALVPLVAGSWLAVLVRDGTGGGAREKVEHDYWAANMRTWVDAPQPALAAAAVELELDPAQSFLRSRGTFTLVNDEPEPLARFALTTGAHWVETRWTIDGRPCEPDTKTLLHVFRPERPLAPGARIELGFAFEGRFPGGVSENGPGAGEFVLPGGVVLTSFSPSFVPVIGFLEGPGIDDENRYEPRDYPDDFHLGTTPSGFGVDVPYPVRVTVRGPAEYTFNSVGLKTGDTVAEGVRTVTWESDHPVLFFNVVAGRWDEARSAGTVIHHAREHAYNVSEMSAALAAARRWYGEWFSPFPWSELKLSEFPGYASYAQGFPTNITFSEQIGFLTSARREADAPFLVTAHEAAHQWWGNRLVPGRGPGGDILSEGMSHFATILLFEQIKGLGARIGFCTGIETRYAEERQADSERPLVKIDGSRAGDTTVTYDKGGWVFWMLLQHLGRERGLAGYRSFLECYEENPDHPVLQDLVEHLRGFTDDPAGYEAFTRQWFFELVLPEYELSGARKEDLADGSWRVQARLRNLGTGSMPVQVAAARGERFPEGEAGQPGAGGAGDDALLAATKPAADYRDERITLTLAAGEEAELEIQCDFEPDELVVDPDALVLQLRRKQARAGL